jgi:hypothetical protein
MRGFFKNAGHFKDIFREFEVFLNFFEDIFREIDFEMFLRST